MNWDNLKNSIRKTFCKLDREKGLDKKARLDKLVENLEMQWLQDANLPFKIMELKSTGFVIKVSGLYGFISFFHMPWKYSNVNYWTSISHKLIGKVFFCKIHSIAKAPLLSIIVNGEIPQFKKIELLTGENYRGIIIEKGERGVFIEIGYHFDWKHGSFVGYMNKSNFDSLQLFSLCSVGDEIEIFYQGVNKDGRFIYSQTNEMVDWNNQIPQSLVGQIVLVHVVRETEDMIKFLVEGKYNGKIYLEKNDTFFGSKQRARKIKNTLKGGDIIHCEVFGFREQPRILKLKWIAELDANIFDSADIVHSSSQDKSTESESKAKGRAKYQNNTVKNNIMNNLDDDTIQKIITIRDTIECAEF